MKMNNSYNDHNDGDDHSDYDDHGDIDLNDKCATLKYLLAIMYCDEYDSQ